MFKKTCTETFTIISCFDAENAAILETAVQPAKYIDRVLVVVEVPECK
jgi:hypothetical protein